MTSPAFVVLTLALVCSTFGTASEPAAEHASKHTMHNQPNTFDNTTKMSRTNIYDYIVTNNYNVNKDTTKSEEVDDIYNEKDSVRENIEVNDADNNNNDIEVVFSKNKNNHFNEASKVKLFSNEINVSKKMTDGKRISQEYDDIYTEDESDTQNFKEHIRSTKPPKRYEEFKSPVAKYAEIRKETVHTVLSNTYYMHPFDKKSQIVRPKSEAIHPWPTNSFFSSNRVKRDDPLSDKDRCRHFTTITKNKIMHPHDDNDPNMYYYSNIECVLVIDSQKPDHVVKLTFIDVFHIEESPKCSYDYLEIRDGQYGFSSIRGRYCGNTFPPEVVSSGPYMWLKFKADETIEYEGFTIKVEFLHDPDCYKISEACVHRLPEARSGKVDSSAIDAKCLSDTGNHDMDALWIITTPPDTDIFLNFTTFELAKPNECEENLVQVFANITEDDKKLAHYCGSTANPVSTRPENKPTKNENVMHVRIFIGVKAKAKTKVSATYVAFRTLVKEAECRPDEFNCEDNTCIAKELDCDGEAHCRLKTDQEERCDTVENSLMSQAHILTILIIFCLIVSGMSLAFLYKCIRKLYQDHKAIKEHIRQSCEDRLDTMVNGSKLPAKLILSAEGLERDNHANEFYKQQRSLSQHKQTSLEPDFQETHLDLDDEPWHREVETIPEHQDAKVQQIGRSRHTDTSKKEESLRSRKQSTEAKKEIKDAAVGAPDTKESGCQTRESLFEAATAPSSDGSNSASNSRGFSTFGYSGATLVRPSPPPAPPAPAISSVQIELLRQLPPMETTHKSQKKIPDRRPMSAETTRSAPDVIIVSKPIR